MKSCRKPVDYAQVQEHASTFVSRFHDELSLMEDIAVAEKFPIIGAAAGEFCYQIAKMSNAKKIFELGSGYGYSTAWFAQAVLENGGGVVHHTVWDEDLSRRAKTHLANMNLADLVEFHFGEALETLQNTDDTFDIIFLDVDKKYYPAALPLIKNKLRQGGLLIVDNMLLRGRIFDPLRIDPTTDGVRDFTKLIQNDKDWNSTLIPIRDGILLATLRT